MRDGRPDLVDDVDPDRAFTVEGVGSGSPELDALLGGGIERDSITVIGGPSGVGVSTTGTHFLVGAAASDEYAVAFLVEEREASLCHRMNAVGTSIGATPRAAR